MTVNVTAAQPRDGIRHEQVVFQKLLTVDEIMAARDVAQRRVAELSMPSPTSTPRVHKRASFGDFEALSHVAPPARRSSSNATGAIVTDGRIKVLTSLREFELTKTLDEDARAQLFQVMTPRMLQPNEQLHTLGDAADSFYIVHSGSLESSNGSETTLLGPGESCGHAALMGELCYFSVRATQASLVWVLDSVLFRSVVADSHRKQQPQANTAQPSATIPVPADATEPAETPADASIADGVAEPTEPTCTNWEIDIYEGDEWVRATVTNWDPVSVMIDVKCEMDGEAVEGSFPADFDHMRLIKCCENESAESVAAYKGIEKRIAAAASVKAEQARLRREEDESQARELKAQAGKLLDHLEAAQPKEDMQTRRDRQIKICSLDRKRILGAGAFGVVWLVQKHESTRYFALKQLAKVHVVAKKQETHVEHERRIMKICAQHPFVVKLIATDQDQDSLFMVLELVPGGELYRRLHADGQEGHGSPLPVADVLFYSSIIVLVWEFIHPQGIVYRDLKPENLLIDQRGYLKVHECMFNEFQADATLITHALFFGSGRRLGLRESHRRKNLHALWFT
jgi:hypothetical protein